MLIGSANMMFPRFHKTRLRKPKIGNVTTNGLASALPSQSASPAPSLDRNQNDAQSYYRNAMACVASGQLEAAIEFLSKVLMKKPDHAPAHNNLGLVLQSLGDIDGAVASFRRALLVNPQYTLARNNLGAAYAAMGLTEAAINCYTESLKHDPHNTTTLNNLGAAYHTIEQNEDAMRCLRLAIANDTNHADAHINLGTVLAALGRCDEATAHFETAIALRPDDAGAHLKLGHLHQKAGHSDRAVFHLRQVCKLDARSDEAQAALGHALQVMGDIDGARRCFRHAIDLNPSKLGPYLSLAHITKLSSDDLIAQAMIAKAGDLSDLPIDEQINGHFALGKILADLGEHDSSFAHFLAGNTLKRQTVQYDERKILQTMQLIKSIMTIEHLKEWCGVSNNNDQHIFIVGMPRSGSTLVEQVLASHPDVISAGESDALEHALKRARAEIPGWQHYAPGFIPTAEQAADFSIYYREALASSVGVSPATLARKHVTNKMLKNFRHVGFIKKIFPNAVIIHTFRDPIETCLSCFSINFSSQNFSFDLGELGRHYRAYAIMMRHWKQVLPEASIFDVRYEAVVQNFEASARAIVAHCGLTWHDDCLRFHETQRPVTTASVAQVRQPIYISSLKRWRPDHATLKPLYQGLGILGPLQ